VRIELANPGQLLKPAMFAQVELHVSGLTKVLAVPHSAVIDSGTRNVVLVQLGEGRFEPREVKVGAHGEKYTQILQGLSEGEQVVVAANFLIDAESNLKAAIGGLAAGAGQAAQPQTAPAAPAAPASVGHKGQGTIDAIDLKAGTISLNHGAIAELKWPAMTMEFNVANVSLLKNLKPGGTVVFEFVERKPGEWVITSLVAAPKVAAKEPAAR